MAIVPVSIAASICGADGGAVGSVLASGRLCGSWLAAPPALPVRPFEPALALAPARPPALLQPQVGVKPASTSWHGAGAGMTPLPVLPELMDGDWKSCCEMERKKSFFSGCKAETCRNEVPLQRPLGTKARSLSFKLQSREPVQTHPFCSPLAGCRCASVARGAGTTPGGVVAWEQRVAEASPGVSRLGGPAAPLPWHSLLSHLGISKACGESSMPRWTFSA